MGALELGEWSPDTNINRKPARRETLWINYD